MTGVSTQHQRVQLTLASLNVIVWALWFGGLVSLFFLTWGLLQQNRGLAMQAGPALLALFERYELVLGVLALGCGSAWHVLRPSRVQSVIVALFILAAVGSLTCTLALTPHLEELLAAGQMQTQQFHRLQLWSFSIHCAQAGILLLIGVLLPQAIRQSPLKPPGVAIPGTVSETPPA